MASVENVPVHAVVTWCLRAAGLIAIAFFAGAKYVPRNRLGGIRFSYTLADDEVWEKVHVKARWWLLAIGLVCFYPLNTYSDFVFLAPIIMGLVIAFAIFSWICARETYRDKFGTTEVVSRGLFKYEPPAEARKDGAADDSSASEGQERAS